MPFKINNNRAEFLKIIYVIEIAFEQLLFSNIEIGLLKLLQPLLYFEK